jgi:hypothetical protein
VETNPTEETTLYVRTILPPPGVILGKDLGKTFENVPEGVTLEVF